MKVSAGRAAFDPTREQFLLFTDWQDHLGQLMKYELVEETGCIYERGELIFDGEKLVKGEQ